MSTVKIEVLRMAQDARGYVFEPLAAADFDRFRNVHVVYSAPGAVRGNHYHVRSTELTSVAGPTLVRYREQDIVHEVLIPSGEVWRFAFPPGVAHAFRNEGVQPSMLASFSTEVHDPAAPDVVRVVLIE